MAGGERFSHLPYLAIGRDILCDLFGLKNMPLAASSLSRLFAKLTSWIRIEILATRLWDYIFSWIPFAEIGADWLDLDSSVITRYGKQQGALIGYNPTKKGRASHHPLLGFLSESRFVVNIWNRSGNCKSANNVLDFFNETYGRLKDRLTFKGVRADSGFYVEDFLEKLELLGLRYIIPAVLYRNLQRRIWNLETWTPIAKGYEATAFFFKPDDWTKERRYVVIRREINMLKGRAVGKQLTFLDPKCKYTYSCFVTNDDTAPPEKIWRDYRPRACDENIIKEYKEDFALCGFCQKNFYATEAGMLIRALALNLLSLFKREILKQKNEFVEKLKTIRFKYFVIPAGRGTAQRQAVLRLSIPLQSLRQKMVRLLSQVSSYIPIIGSNCNAVGPPKSPVGEMLTPEH